MKDIGGNFVDFYRFFDLEFSIWSDSEKVLGVFRDILSRFLIEEKDGVEISYHVLTKGDASGLSKIIADDKVYVVEDPGDLIGYAYMKIMDAVLSKVASHYMFHAASLSVYDMGIIFPAASKSGKTTLTLELLKRGFKFLSDDVAAISRSDYTIHPFLKGLGMLPYTLELCPEAGLDFLGYLPMIGGGEKRLLDIEDLYQGSIGKPCQVKYLIFLGDIPELREQMADEENLYIVMNKITDELISDLKGIEGIRDVSIHPYKKFPILKLLLDGKGSIFSRVEDICYRHQALIFDSSNGKEEMPDFGDTPRLERISKSKASLQLLKEIKGGYRASILQDECGGSVSKLLMNIGRLLEGVECFYLTPGRLKERADRICEMVGFCY